MPMRTFTQNEPLTDAELDRLGDFLKSCKGGKAMNVEALDGFFAALIAGPETVMPPNTTGRTSAARCRKTASSAASSPRAMEPFRGNAAVFSQTYCAHSSAGIRAVTSRPHIAAACLSDARSIRDERDSPALRDAFTITALIFGRG